MPIALKYLCKYTKENYGMNLVCGERNMTNLVNWVHMLEDPETARFLNGQELIFTTGIGHDDSEWLVDFAKMLVRHGASGLVINIGPYIKSLPKDLVVYCREVQFPLLTIPWSTRIVDITYDFCRKIIKAEEAEMSIAAAFKNIIFFPEKSAEYRAVLERKEFDVGATFHVIALSLGTQSAEQMTLFDKTVRLHLMKALLDYNDRFVVFRQDKVLIIIVQDSTNEVLRTALEKVIGICAEPSRGLTIHAGISPSANGIETLSHNYKRAVAILEIALKQDKSILSHESLGIYQLLIEVENPAVMKEYYMDIIGKLVEYDEQNGTDYIETLKIYLESNASVQEVAAKTFVHRNTINYKLKKIKEILGCTLTVEEGMQILLALKIRELF